MAIFNTFCKMDSSFLASKDSSCIYLSLPILHILCDCLLHPCSACQVLIKRIKMYNLDPYVFAMRLQVPANNDSLYKQADRIIQGFERESLEEFLLYWTVKRQIKFLFKSNSIKTFLVISGGRTF